MVQTRYYPDYLSDYACKCGDCRRTCCNGLDWTVSMSRPEFDAAEIEAAGNKDLAAFKPFLEEMAQASDGNAEVALPLASDGRCILLEEDGKCSWRVCTGQDICAICRDFPIQYLRLFEDEYAYPSGACEAVLEALLRKQDKISLCSRPLETDEAPCAYQTDLSEADVARDSVFGAYPVLVRLGLDVLQDGRYSLDQRMALLVSDLNVVDKMAQVGQAASLDAALSSMQDERRVAMLLESFEHDTREGNPAVRLCSELYRTCLDSNAYRSLAQRILDNLGFTVVANNPKARGKLRLPHPELLGQRRERYRSYLQDKTDFLAKVMVSIYLHSGVPLTGPDPWAATRYFALCYALIKFGIIGAFDDVPTDEELVDLLVPLLRAFTHNSMFYRNTVEWIDGLKFTDVNDCIKMVLW